VEISPEERQARHAAGVIRQALADKISKSFMRAALEYRRNSRQLHSGGSMTEKDWASPAARLLRVGEICEYLAGALYSVAINGVGGYGINITKEDVLEAVRKGFPPTRGPGALKPDSTTLEIAFTKKPFTTTVDLEPGLKQNKVDRYLAGRLHRDERTIRSYRASRK
jgi:hypothetical protein